jgi:hypothetical protein
MADYLRARIERARVLPTQHRERYGESARGAAQALPRLIGLIESRLLSKDHKLKRRMKAKPNNSFQAPAPGRNSRVEDRDLLVDLVGGAGPVIV